VRLHGERLIRTDGHFIGREVTGPKFMLTLDGVRYQFETAKVREYLRDPARGWPMRPNRRNGRSGNMPRQARRLADRRLLDLIDAHPQWNIRTLAEQLRIAHPSVSRRIARLRLAGVLTCGSEGWETHERPGLDIDDDPLHGRTLLSLLRSFASLSVYRAAKLAAITKHAAHRILDGLAARGLVVIEDNRACITSAGVASLAPPRSTRFVRTIGLPAQGVRKPPSTFGLPPTRAELAELDNSLGCG
jgi:DNA-binding MarR family transcriptional regulator